MRLLAAVRCSSAQVAEILGRPKAAVRVKACALGVRFASLQFKCDRRLYLKDMPDLHELINGVRAAKQDLSAYLISKGYVTKTSQKNILIRVRSGWSPSL